jgi:hypothetical protein
MNELHTFAHWHSDMPSDLVALVGAEPSSESPADARRNETLGAPVTAPGRWTRVNLGCVQLNSRTEAGRLPSPKNIAVYFAICLSLPAIPLASEEWETFFAKALASSSVTRSKR